MSGRRIAIVAFCNDWDEFIRRDRRLMAGLAQLPDIVRIIYVVDDSLTLTSLAKFLFGKADLSATNQWHRLWRDGWITNRGGGKIQIVPSLSVLPYARKCPGRRFNLKLMNRIRIWTARSLLRSVEADHLILWISTPYHTFELIGRFGEDAVCYSLCEDYCEKHPEQWYRDLLVKEDICLTHRADVVMVASQYLLRAKLPSNGNTHLISNGVAYNEIQDGEFIMPDDLQSLGRPIIGHMGRIGPYTDVRLLELLADKYIDASIVLIGPYDEGNDILRHLSERHNVHFLGARPNSQIPAYLLHFDVCVVLYRDTYQNKARDSMKLYQYLATGKPIVSYPVGGAERFDDPIYLAKDKDHFVDLVGKAIAENDGGLVELRKACARENSWDVRIQQVHALITQTLDEKAWSK